jgi:hypothetical protein
MPENEVVHIFTKPILSARRVSSLRVRVSFLASPKSSLGWISSLNLENYSSPKGLHPLVQTKESDDQYMLLIFKLCVDLPDNNIEAGALQKNES